MKGEGERGGQESEGQLLFRCGPRSTRRSVNFHFHRCLFFFGLPRVSLSVLLLSEDERKTRKDRGRVVHTPVEPRTQAAAALSLLTRVVFGAAARHLKQKRCSPLGSHVVGGRSRLQPARGTHLVEITRVALFRRTAVVGDRYWRCVGLEDDDLGIVDRHRGFVVSERGRTSRCGYPCGCNRRLRFKDSALPDWSACFFSGVEACFSRLKPSRGMIYFYFSTEYTPRARGGSTCSCRAKPIAPLQIHTHFTRFWGEEKQRALPTQNKGNASQPRIDRTEVGRVCEGCSPYSPAQPEGAPRWAQGVSENEASSITAWIGTRKIELVF